MRQARQGKVPFFPGSNVDADVALQLGSAAARQAERSTPWRPPLGVYETATELVASCDIAGLAAVRLPFPVDERSSSAENTDGLPTVTQPRLAPTTNGPRSRPEPVRIQQGEQ